MSKVYDLSGGSSLGVGSSRRQTSGAHAVRRDAPGRAVLSIQVLELTTLWGECLPIPFTPTSSQPSGTPPSAKSVYGRSWVIDVLEKEPVGVNPFE